MAPVHDAAVEGVGCVVAGGVRVGCYDAHGEGLFVELAAGKGVVGDCR